MGYNILRLEFGVPGPNLETRNSQLETGYHSYAL